METYSHSKIETFENCKLRYKYRYIDKIVPDVPKSIEAHLGSAVHKALEELYMKVMQKEIPTVDMLIKWYSDEWELTFTKDILIVNKSMALKDYFNRGVEFLINYYLKHQPFKDNTIATEEKVEINLDEEKKLVGYIDRLVHNLEKNEIEIHDYKTSASTFAKQKIENGRQLALYALAMKEKFGKEKNISMVWHFLAHDTKTVIPISNERLALIKKEVIELIDEIQNTKIFPPTKSFLCNWCEYRKMCEAWKTPRGQGILGI
jgi:DNA helicase-2/ATP-dependent DNA helicase PcrA